MGCIYKEIASTTGCRVHGPGVGYTAFIEQFTSPKLVTEPTDLVHSIWADSRVEGQEVSTNSLQQVAPTVYETTDLVPATHWSQELQVLKGARANHPGISYTIDWQLLSGGFLLLQRNPPDRLQACRRSTSG